ncbi:hypothetical protein F4553_001912 [Allocatelliglobosispora scoriae]|uniref:Uncharacterized protein n=1 Tax=Allocatelliglobosispora scoriae TaxID=643052 RepID=A0A841BNK0_9ACTN|nr:hypothetical protein [Allocatelliglobosispora scoriae]MBB5868533.1 hypothetical protein [Allocatelliglobosispora scoriae]
MKMSQRILATTLSLSVLAYPAMAVANPAAGGELAPLEPRSTYGAALNAKIASFDQRLAAHGRSQAAVDAKKAAVVRRRDAYDERGQSVRSQLDANKQKIDAHNAVVAGYPNGAPPTVAARLNAEADQLNAEKQRLFAQAEAVQQEAQAIADQQQEIQGKVDTLDRESEELSTERRHLGQLIAAVPDDLVRAMSAIASASGGDAPRMSSPTGPGSAVDGGDPVSSSPRRAALARYQQQTHREIDKRQFEIKLSPDALSKVPTDKAGILPPSLKVDGTARNDDKTYQALLVRDPQNVLTPEQKAFIDTISDGGRAYVVVGREKRIITGFTIVDGLAQPTAGQSAAPFFQDPSGPSEYDGILAQDRAEELQAIRNDYPNADKNGATVVVGVFNKRTRTSRTLIAINGFGTSAPPSWKGNLREGEEFVPYEQDEGADNFFIPDPESPEGLVNPNQNHAEGKIVLKLLPDEVIAFGGVWPNVCRDSCFRLLNGQELAFGGEGHRGGNSDKTPFSRFWVADWWH